jgi:DNA-binding MarR family transcriptional regulator
MAPVSLSRLQKRILLWLARDEKRSRGMISSAHRERIGALPSAKGNISHSLRLLESQGFVVIGRTLGGKAESLYLTAAGHQRVANLSEVMNKELSMQKQ